MKFVDLKRRLCILGIFFVALSAICLYLGSKPMSWEYQTWEGNSLKEIEYRSMRFTQAHIGLILLFIGSILQLVNLLKIKDIKWAKKISRIY
ncbi:MAG: hypothetical protein U9Q85_02285 [Patescibacteria group bacterium]|nr:hypothetical protein [Patescibacteria group bacterium]